MWAFGTSLYGLNLASEHFWSLTSRELHALKLQWARAQAQALNLQAATDGVPFIPEDFLGLSDHAVRVQEAKAQREIEQMEVAAENFKLLMFQGGKEKMDETGVPEWMIKASKRRG